MPVLYDVLHRNAEPYKVKLIRGQKGGYGWEITVSGDTQGFIIDELIRIDERLKIKFGGEEWENREDKEAVK